MSLTDQITSAFPERHGLSGDDVRALGVARRRRTTRRRNIMVAATVMVVSVLGVTVSGVRSATVLAGWTPRPQQAEPAVIGLVDRTCRDAFAYVPQPDRSDPFDRWDRDLATAAGHLRPTVVDARGNAGVALYHVASGGETLEITCDVVWRPGSDMEVVSSGAGGTSVRSTRPFDGVVVDGGFGSTTPELGDKGSIAALHGRMAREVRTVRVTLADGTVVTATTGDGHWLAWWPSRDRGGVLAWLPDPTRPTMVEALDAAGHVIAVQKHNRFWEHVPAPADAPTQKEQQ